MKKYILGVIGIGMYMYASGAGDMSFREEDVDEMVSGNPSHTTCAPLPDRDLLNSELNDLYHGYPGNRVLIGDLVAQELAQNPHAIYDEQPMSDEQYRSKPSEEGGRLQRMTSIARVLARVAENKQTAFVESQQETQGLRDQADIQQKDLHKERVKRLWAIMTAVGSTVLAVASTVWGAIETTGQKDVMVNVMCNYSMPL